jgi:tetratricopeptide (TPR) repeat protein
MSPLGGGSAVVSVERYQDFVFRDADLSEDVDLDLERRKEILFAHARLATSTHWEVLGLRWNATAANAKAAYLDKVRLFHPDRYAGRRIGSYRQRLERIFKRITEARDVLADEARRAAYATATAPPEELARATARKAEDDRRVQERRARLVRHNPLLARASRVGDLVKRAKAALAEGRLSEAANDLVLARGLDPQNDEIAALAADARKRAGVARAAELLDRGLRDEALGDTRGALARYREAVEADPGNVRAAARGARAAVQVGDATVARSLAEAALKAGPRSGIAHEVLGAVLELEGKKKEARRAYERALELDPALGGAKERLKKLRWGFLG